MKKLPLLLLIVLAVLSAKAQTCTPFLGGDKLVIPCSNPFQINYQELFNTTATFDITELPAKDTVKGINGQDSIRAFKSVTKAVATQPNGCKDSAVVRVVLIYDPLPNLGADKRVYLKTTEIAADISNEYNTFGYDRVEWSLPNPAQAPEGVHRLVVFTWFGCSDTAFIKVEKCPQPNVGKDSTTIVCAGTPVDLTSLVNANGLIQNWTSNWPYAEDKAGIYRLIATDNIGCNDTAVITVEHLEKPDLGNDKTLLACKGVPEDLTVLYNTENLSAVWNTTNPAQAYIGLYRLIVVNENNCKDTAYVEIEEMPKPRLGDDITICVGVDGKKTDLTALLSSKTAGLTMDWGLPASVSQPTSVPAGTYKVIGRNIFGCADTVFIYLLAVRKPDLGPDIADYLCRQHTTNLNDFFNLENLTAVWDTKEPETAPPGRYMVIAANALGCKDTASILLSAHARTGLKDTTVFACGSNTVNLTTIYNTSQLADFFWEAENPEAVTPGFYNLILQDLNFCEDTVSVEVSVSPNPNNGILPITIFRKEDGNAGAFTTNDFNTVTTDKFGNIWAGANLGGLYRYQSATGWVKSGHHPNSSYKDLLEFDKAAFCNCPADGTEIWAAGNGYDGVNATAGGVDKITVSATSDNFSTQYFGAIIRSSGGIIIDSSGALSSRYGNSLAIGGNGRVYVALGQSLRYDTSFSFPQPPLPPIPEEIRPVVMEGGVFEYDLVQKPQRFKGTNIPTQLEDVRVYAAGRRNNGELWFAVDKSCKPVINQPPNCTNGYIVRWGTAGGFQSSLITEGNSPIPFASKNFLTVKSIFTAADGRTYVGLSDGLGIAVMWADGHWDMVTSSNSRLPMGASINFNAITEVNGEIWIGTTKGLLVYDGVGNLTDCSSYILYTTENGLPSNNVTDIAYDITQFNVWFTTDNGVCTFVVPHSVRGIVYNAYCGKPEALLPQIATEGLEGATIKLFDKNGTVVQTQTVDASGQFNLDLGELGKKYDLEITFGGFFDFTYRYENIPFDTLIGAVLIADSLIRELEALATKMHKRCFVIQGLPFDIGGKFSLNICADGFHMTDYDLPYLEDYKDETILQEPGLNLSMVENLAVYYLGLSTMYSLGGTYSDLMNEGMIGILDAVHSLFAFAECGTEFNFKKKGETASEIRTEEVQKQIINAGKLLFEGIKIALNAALNMAATGLNLNDNEKAEYAKYISTFAEAGDNALKIAANGKAGGAANLILDAIKKAVAQEMASSMYKSFCQYNHEYFIQDLALKSKNRKATIPYASAYNNLFNLAANETEPNSLLFEAGTILADTKKAIEGLRKLANTTDAAAGYLDAAAKFSLIIAPLLGPGAPASVAAAEAFKVAATAAKVVQTGSLALVTFEGFKGALAVSDISNGVTKETGFELQMRQEQVEPKLLGASPLVYSPNLLIEKKRLYTQKLLDLQIVASQPYDSASVINALIRLRIADSAFQTTFSGVLKTLLATTPEAAKIIPGFAIASKTAFDTTVFKYYQLAHVLGLEIAAFEFSEHTSIASARLLGAIDEVRDAVNKSVTETNLQMQQLVDNNIPVPAYLSLEAEELNFSNRYNAAGTIRFIFKNVGLEEQKNVRLKVRQSKAGFSFAGADSVYIGTIQPGSFKEAMFSFTSPGNDTTGVFQISVMADNGFTSDISGTLSTYEGVAKTVKNGLWADKSTWSNNIVPGANTKTTITHNVTVNMNAFARSLKAEAGATIVLEPYVQVVIVK